MRPVHVLLRDRTKHLWRGGETRRENELFRVSWQVVPYAVAVSMIPWGEL